MNRKIYITISIITISLYLLQSSLFASEGMDFNIKFDKTEYSKKDQISVTFELINRSKEAIYVNNRFYLNSEESPKGEREIYLIITHESGDIIGCKVSRETGIPKSDFFVFLKPGNKAKIKRAINIRHMYDFDKPGAYEIKAAYHNVYGSEIGLPAFGDKIWSKPITIKIIEEGSE